MCDEPNDKSPQETFRAGVKAAVEAVNSGLASIEKTTESIRIPAASTWSNMSTQASALSEKATYTYQRRHEFAPEIVGGSAFLGGGIMALRRGRVAGVLSAAIAGGAAYAVVYDEINFDQVPDMIFGKKE
mmetsp:Transcript_125912/g.187947  ORF Transcript_125912/g.187947 Transcript_125912/m.187947 type:complete len:130 (+) Transcript_125912:81-470(+)|eukprot:CAMPEP_0117006772 /NCGR_PEP_ID=MMETSP0472-20121206/6882_1 /TAXON_ID=693140 ORGANISM="Tiarina fusus, Strain LIS" /NCGR_SAMPLE_ID=MMETSP0472 /ASSEMBLY_ACC=CAM_ASM_000603 /LENGTH=129 /DNA_ID=CAMNT_0004708335 /DNA_START=81 /DNA_END=470 /DNA_ORIENTATION=-